MFHQLKATLEQTRQWMVTSANKSCHNPLLQFHWLGSLTTPFAPTIILHSSNTQQTHLKMFQTI